MKLTSDSYRELGKTFLNIGQSIIIAISQKEGGREKMTNFLIGVGFLLLVAFAFFLYDRYQDRRSTRP